VILPDVNVLVYAYRREADHHERYAAWLREVAVGAEDLGLLETVLTGFVRVVTNPRVFADPAPTVDALTMVDALRGLPNARGLAATDASWARLAAIAAEDVAVRGNLIPDAHLASIAIVHGARVATSDRGFARFPGLRWFDPVDRAGRG
jgi:toxin-antitoxin system PIN domain toxin